MTQSGRLDFTIPAYQTRSYMVTFAPTAEGLQTGDITVTSNISGYESITVPVSGLGYVNNPPAVSNINIAGIPVPTMMQTATYTFTDPDSDAEGPSTYQWYRITPPSTEPVAIANATALTYRLVLADVGSHIAFKVSPIDQHLMPGLPVMSEPSPIIEPLPAPQDLDAQVIENRDVLLNWVRPNYFDRDLLGYRIFRNNLPINVINNVNITTFTDTWLDPGEYQYWVTSVFTNPVSQSGPSNIVTINIVSNNDETTPVVESMQVYPDPFKTNTTVNITTKANAAVEASVFNIKGQLVQKLKGTTNSNGNVSLRLDRNACMISGLYFVKVTTPNGSHTQKVMVLQ